MAHTAKKCAAEEAQKQESVPDLHDYGPGTVINHPIYGKGTVKSILVRNGGTSLEIDFDTVGIKNINAEWLKQHSSN